MSSIYKDSRIESSRAVPFATVKNRIESWRRCKFGWRWSRYNDPTRQIDSISSKFESRPQHKKTSTLVCLKGGCPVLGIYAFETLEVLPSFALPGFLRSHIQSSTFSFQLAKSTRSFGKEKKKHEGKLVCQWWQQTDACVTIYYECGFSIKQQWDEGYVFYNKTLIHSPGKPCGLVFSFIYKRVRDQPYQWKLRSELYIFKGLSGIVLVSL